MQINDYYLQELHALRKTGAEFAQNNPGLAPYLAKEGQDPDVERMLEGFCFLTGRLRQLMDDELPELSHNLVQLLWPNYIRPIPSMSIVQYEELFNDFKAQKIEKGTTLLSSQKGMPKCRFRTCYETLIEAYNIEDVIYTVQGNRSSLDIKFFFSKGATFKDLNLKQMRLHLVGSRLMAKEIYLFLSRYVQSLNFELLDTTGKTLQNIMMDINCINPEKFDKDHTILPYPRNVFDGYALLQEYFCFEEKYYFINFENLNLLKHFKEQYHDNAASFKMKIVFNKQLPQAYNPSKDNFALYCTPIINLFTTDAAPIRKNPSQEEYLVMASEFKKDESEVFLVNRVRGWVPSKNIYEKYFPFETFKENGKSSYYSQRVKILDDMKSTQIFLRFANPEGTYDDATHNVATVSVECISTNRDLPSLLAIGAINEVSTEFDLFHMNFKNITIPTCSYPPPIGGDFLWKVISNMSLNYLSLTNLSTLKTILKTYDFIGFYDHKHAQHTDHMLNGLVNISYTHSSIIYEGLPLRGITTTLKVDLTKFSSKGEMYLFCDVLNEFLALYGNINTFHKLRVETNEGEVFEWEAKMGYDVLK